MTNIADFAQRYADAWCSQKPASVSAFFSENGSLQVNSGAPAVGRKAIAEVARAFMIALPDMRVALDMITAEGERTIFHWTLTGTNTGPGGTGKAVRIRGHEDWRFDVEGLIAESLGHFDSDEYERQLANGV